MKVILLNLSPNEKGCTYTALCEAAGALNECGVETEIIYAGAPAFGCRACKACYKAGRCVFGDNDGVNAAAEKIKDADGLIIGSAVHYAAASGSGAAFLDRLFYAHGKSFAFKPAAAVVSCRRGGASAAFDQLIKYFTICNMPVVSSQYWNQVHGSLPEEVLKDEEGMQTMRTLGRNMAWLIKCINCAKSAGIPMPERESVIRTNFIR